MTMPVPLEHEIRLWLTDAEIKQLRSCISDLGINDQYCVRLQLKIANAILDSTYKNRVKHDT